ncbi:MAG: hypothetical protein WCE75_16425 [Terracidiphilus sp.]
MNDGYMFGYLIGGALMGLVCGLLPYFVGKKKNVEGLPVTALWVCAVCGLLLGILLALPVAIVFTVVIANKAKAQSRPPMPTISVVPRPSAPAQSAPLPRPVITAPKPVAQPVTPAPPPSAVEERYCPNCYHIDHSNAPYCERCGQRMV